MRALFAACFLLIVVAAPTVSITATDVVDPADFDSEHEQSVAAILLDPGAKEEALLNHIIMALETCVGVPTLRTHSIYGAVLQVREYCADPSLVTAVFHSLAETYLQTNLLPDEDDVRAEYTRQVQQAISGTSASSPSEENGATTATEGDNSTATMQAAAAPDYTQCVYERADATGYNPETAIRISVYYDSDLDYPDERDKQISWFYNFIAARADGEYAKHTRHPNTNFCIVWSGPVPSQHGLDGNIGSRLELLALRDYESGFTDHDSDIVAVMGMGKINTPAGIANGYGPEVLTGSAVEPFYFNFYTYGVANAGMRIAIHELGHVMGLDHDSCIDGPHADWNDYVHIMGFSWDADASCTPYPGDTWHVHTNWLPSQVPIWSATHETWCNSVNSSCF